jgi:hypothetical protein
MSPDELARSLRVEAILDLIQIRRPISEAMETLLGFAWDSEEELVTLRRGDALMILNNFESGNLSAVECSEWAEALEGREDISLESGFEDLIKDFLFELSAPEINGPLTVDSSALWKERIGLTQEG